MTDYVEGKAFKVASGLEVNLGGNGLPWSIQTTEKVTAVKGKVNIVRQYGGISSPHEPWPDDGDDDGQNDRLLRLERFVGNLVQETEKHRSGTASHGRRKKHSETKKPAELERQSNAEETSMARREEATAFACSKPDEAHHSFKATSTSGKEVSVQRPRSNSSIAKAESDALKPAVEPTTTHLRTEQTAHAQRGDCSTRRNVVVSL
eukprot:TRINITY_DN92469_c0_g1_i1.p1 TRINITY_DN92469_c0_g1~~TRINITY_DN92469_c0_g1_i1.p1  ORF type:complete len:206 (-),score=36.52 TRINITY_DN92469_c0_g1_i1:12-629(-)